jgi:hypothetical protein
VHRARRGIHPIPRSTLVPACAFARARDDKKKKKTKRRGPWSVHVPRTESGGHARLCPSVPVCGAAAFKKAWPHLLMKQSGAAAEGKPEPGRRLSRSPVGARELAHSHMRGSLDVSTKIFGVGLSLTSQPPSQMLTTVSSRPVQFTWGPDPVPPLPCQA